MTALSLLLLTGELFFFRLCNRVLRSYLDPELAPLQRIELAFAAMFMTEGWFTHLKETDEKQKKAEQISKSEEKARVRAEQGILAKEYDRQQREARKQQRAEAKAEQEKKKREAKKLKEAAKKQKKSEANNRMTTTVAPPLPSPLPPASSAATHAPKRPTVASQFTTRTAATGISFNAWFLFGFVYTLITNDDLRRNVPFAPRQLTEQEAEKVFRAARAILGGENFTLTDFMRRCNHLVAHGILKARHNGVDFVYPEPASAWKWDERMASDSAARLPDTITIEELLAAVKSARAIAIEELRQVGIDVDTFVSVRHLDVDNHADELDVEAEEDQQSGPAVQATEGEMKQLQAELERVAEEEEMVHSAHYFSFTDITYSCVKASLLRAIIELPMLLYELLFFSFSSLTNSQ